MKHLFSDYSFRTRENAIEAYMKDFESNITDPVLFSIGLPNKELLPKQQMQRIINSLFDSGNTSLFNYCGSKGVSSLISTISRKENISEDHIMITSGNTQGVELCTRLFLNLNDAMAVEEYTYALAHSAVEQFNLNPFVIPLDKDGLDVSYLESILKNHSIKMLYIIPNAQNPTGVTLSLEKRKKLVELAYTYDFVILEDDPYRDLIFGNRLPSLFELDLLKEKVLYLYSFSKTIAPTLRTGYILAHPIHIQKLEQFKQTNDSCSSPLNQMIVNQMITSNEWQNSLLKQQSFYEVKKDITKKFLDKMNRQYGWTSIEPEGGLFYWVDTNYGDILEYLKYTVKNGVVIVPGNAFALSDETSTKFRLCYSYCDSEEMNKGFERMEKSFIEYQKNNSLLNDVRSSI